jgi:hypothetical protein
VAQQYIHRLQPLHDIVRQLLQAGLSGTCLHQLPRPTTLTMGDDNVDVSRAKLSRLLLLHRVGRCADQRPDSRDPCLWGQSESRPQPNPFKGSHHQLLGESAQAHFHLTMSISASIAFMRSYVGSWVCARRSVGVILPEDVARREANHANNERRQARKQRRQLRSATQTATRARGEETPSKPESS